MQIVSVDFTVAPENIQRALDQFGHTAAEVRQMAGALRYDIYVDPRGNGSVLIYQIGHPLQTSRFIRRRRQSRRCFPASNP